VGLPSVGLAGMLLGPLDNVDTAILGGLLLAWLIALVKVVLHFSKVSCPRCGTRYSRGKYLSNCPSCGLRMLQEDS
jgi:hypothetical protein